MNATIDIKTPAGQSLSGCPFMLDLTGAEVSRANEILDEISFFSYQTKNLHAQLHKGDKIIIEIV